MLTYRKRLVEAQIALARVEAELEHLRDTAALHRAAHDRMQDEKMSLSHQLAIANDAIDQKMKLVAETLEREKALEIKNAVLMERLDLVANHGLGAPEPTGERKHLSEAEEDLQFAHQAGLINTEQLEQLLAEAGLSNSDITFDIQSTRLP